MKVECNRLFNGIFLNISHSEKMEKGSSNKAKYPKYIMKFVKKSDTLNLCLSK